MTNKFLKEILGQPQALEDTLNYYLYGEGQPELEKVSSIWNQGKFNKVIFTGMGSLYSAPQEAGNFY